MEAPTLEGGPALARWSRRVRNWRGDAPQRVCEELLSEHLDALYRTALRLYGGREADAEDLLQETALRALQGFQSLRDPQAGRAWLFTILVRTFRNRLRTVERRAETLAADLDEAAFEDALAAWRPAPTPEELLTTHRLHEWLTVALDALDASLRVVLWLVDIEGFRQREVAEMLEIPEGTVASRLYRARQRLRETWTDAGLHRRKQGEA